MHQLEEKQQERMFHRFSGKRRQEGKVDSCFKTRKQQLPHTTIASSDDKSPLLGTYHFWYVVKNQGYFTSARTIIELILQERISSRIKHTLSTVGTLQ